MALEDPEAEAKRREREARRAQREEERARRQVELAKRQEAKGFATQVLDMVGLGPIPEDAQWLAMTRKNPKTGKVEEMARVAAAHGCVAQSRAADPHVPSARSLQGSLLVSIELLPRTVADARPAAKARSEPNMNPYLPPPTGRMKLVRPPCSLPRPCTCSPPHRSRCSKRCGTRSMS